MVFDHINSILVFLLTVTSKMISEQSTFHSDGFHKKNDTNSKGWYILNFNGPHVKISKYWCMECMSLMSISSSSWHNVDSEEMPPYLTFHLGLHCLLKYPFYCYPE